jgi:2-haloacid dehalogenase
VRPSVLVFDVNETLSDLSPMAGHFARVGCSEGTARWWFASLLRDGFALTAAGTNPRFADVAGDALRSVLAGQPLNRSVDDAVAVLLDRFRNLGVHDDVVPGITALAAGGHRLITLTNGAAAIAEGLTQRAGIEGSFERFLSVEDAPLWKPASSAYAYAAGACGTRVGDMMLIASHPWDIDGAARAGMRTAWLNRGGSPYPSSFRRPDLVLTTLPELARRLDGR